MESATLPKDRDANYWWLRLVYAIRAGEFSAAAAAQERLARLGVHVRIDRYDGLLRQGGNDAE